jgi:hypothetical protein
MICLFFDLWKLAIPLTIKLFDSVAPDVNTTSLGPAPINAATWLRASSTAASASQPYACVRLWGLPYCSVKRGIMRSRTRGSIGVVACASR